MQSGYPAHRYPAVAARRRRSYQPPRLGLVVLVAVLLGLVGAILLAPAPGPNTVTPIPSFSAPVVSSSTALLFVVGFVIFVLVTLFLPGIFSASRPAPQLLIGLLAIGLVAAGFVVLFHVIHPSTLPGGNATVEPPQNDSNGSCIPGKNCPPPVNVVGPGGSAPWFTGYLLYGSIVAIVLLAVLLIPLAQSAFSARAVLPPEESGAARRSDLERALHRLASSGPSDDPRRRIIRAYGELLEKVQPGLSDVDTSTPREIAANCATVLGVRLETALELTGLFEEARYSQGHPMAPDAVPRAEAALHRAIADVDERRRRGT
jgi:hypothetical protein